MLTEGDNYLVCVDRVGAIYITVIQIPCTWACRGWLVETSGIICPFQQAERQLASLSLLKSYAVYRLNGLSWHLVYLKLPFQPDHHRRALLLFDSPLQPYPRLRLVSSQALSKSRPTSLLYSEATSRLLRLPYSVNPLLRHHSAR